MSEAPGPINFTMFLTMFGERLNGTDPEDVIRNAFACFDEEGSGKSINKKVVYTDHGTVSVWNFFFAFMEGISIH